MDTRNTKKSKNALKANANDTSGSRWKGSLPTDNLSDFNNQLWVDIVPQKSQRTIPKFEQKYDYPFGTTRSNIKIDYTSDRITYTFGPRFFKPASLRQEESHLKNEDSQINGEFQWGRDQKPTADIVEQVTSIKPFQNKRFFKIP